MPKPRFPERVHTLASSPAHQALVSWELVPDGSFAVHVRDITGLLLLTGTRKATRPKSLRRNFQLWGFLRLGFNRWHHHGIQPGSPLGEVRAIKRVKGPAHRRPPLPAAAPAVAPAPAQQQQVPQKQLQQQDAVAAAAAAPAAAAPAAPAPTAAAAAAPAPAAATAFNAPFADAGQLGPMDADMPDIDEELHALPDVFMDKLGMANAAAPTAAAAAEPPIGEPEPMGPPEFDIDRILALMPELAHVHGPEMVVPVMPDADSSGAAW